MIPARHHHRVETRGLPRGATRLSTGVWTMLRPVSWFHKVKLLCIPRIQNLVLDCMSNVQSKCHVDLASAEASAGGNVFCGRQPSPKGIH